MPKCSEMQSSGNIECRWDLCLDDTRNGFDIRLGGLSITERRSAYTSENRPLAGVCEWKWLSPIKQQLYSFKIIAVPIWETKVIHEKRDLSRKGFILQRLKKSLRSKDLTTVNQHHTPPAELLKSESWGSDTRSFLKVQHFHWCFSGQVCLASWFHCHVCWLSDIGFGRIILYLATLLWPKTLVVGIHRCMETP
jgi:hypothetical protein